MQTVVMVVEGVLRMEGSEGHYDDGVTLYRALSKESRLYLLSGIWTEAQMDQWLFSRNLKGHVGYHKSFSKRRVDAMAQLQKWKPALIVESHLQSAPELVFHGYHVLLLARPAYEAPRWQPDYKATPVPWDDLRAEQERQEDLRYADERLRECD